MKKKKKTDENEKKRISGESDDKGVFLYLNLFLENKCNSKCSYRIL
jgi:hypothetical protein